MVLAGCKSHRLLVHLQGTVAVDVMFDAYFSRYLSYKTMNYEGIVRRTFEAHGLLPWTKDMYALMRRKLTPCE
jgi:hypothetical protein